MLGDDDFGDVLPVGFLFVVVLAVQEHDNVGVLFQGAGFPQIGEHGALDLPRFYAAGELGEGDDGDFEFPGQRFEGAGDFRNLLLAVVAASHAAPLHELEVVDDDEVQAVFRL